MKTKSKLILSSAMLMVLTGIGCNNNNSANPLAPSGNAQAPVASPTPGGGQAPVVTFTQVDRLARPAINEGLIVNDASLNAFNSIPPSADLSDAAAPVRTEAANTLNAFAKLGRDLGLMTPAPPVAVTVGAFLPDVMRIDTRTNAPPGTTAYNASVSGTRGILTGGRKPEDDVMDITLSFLVAGDPTGSTVKDNVEYAGVPGNPNQPGHKLLNGQTARLGPAQFPFLATPN